MSDVSGSVKTKTCVVHLRSGYTVSASFRLSAAEIAMTNEGVGSTKKWERIESFSPKFVENSVLPVQRRRPLYCSTALY